ncbi:hypothetical protein [Nocardioides litoris]|uniref:hypothetical protein n=1 Tax=Nocardioides litoris TaxID=1926648 RepID=UPI00111E9E3A|nr:hypothetical protein [Nocardioides litoris]
MTPATRAGRVLLGLTGAVVLVRVLVHVGVAGGGLVGDESYYVDAARAVSNAVRDLASLRAPDTAELDRIAVGSGWFMPGMSAVLTPLFLLVPDAPVALVRGYLLLASTGLLAVAVLRVRRTFGDVAAGAVLVFPGLVPTYAAFGAAAWGDSAAGLALVVVLCHAVESVRDVRAGEAVGLRRGAAIGAWAIAAVYFRSSVVLVVLGVLGVTFLVTLALAGRRGSGRVVAAYVVAGVCFLGLLAPWSLGASAALDARVVTTVSVPTVRANTFGDRDRVCFGECDVGTSIWFSPLRYSREQGRAAGVSETVVADEMSAHARRDVTAQSYARDVGINTGRYLVNPSRFVTLLRWPGSPYDVVPVAAVLTWALFYPAIVVMLVLLGAVGRRRFDDALQLVLLKVAVLALLVQPFVHIAGPRYWTTMAPLLGLGAALLWRLRADRRADARLDEAEPAGVVRVLHAAQVALGVGFAAVIVAVALLAV